MVTLKAVRQPDFDLAYRMLARQIAGEYERHRFVLEGDMSEKNRKRYEEILWEKADRGSLIDSLKFLSECLENYYGKKTIILIDEYDVPLENSFFAGFYDEMVYFIRSLFESAFKTNSSLEFAVITGCLRISKESIFTGMNNLEVISILNRNYAGHFGFTDDEVKQICRDFKLDDKYGTAKEWYDGYIFGNTHVYNPWSIIRFIKDMLADAEAKEELEALIEGRTVEKPVHEDITYDEVYHTIDHLWNFMFFTGYFRKVSERMDAQDELWATFAIPNKEVKYIFRTKILAWFGEKVKAKDRTQLFQAVLEHDAKKMEKEITELLFETISFNDAYENFYHGFLLGILSGMKGYVVKSNREGGSGRSDLCIRPLTRRKEAFVVEFKVAKKFCELEKRAQDALKQIEKRQYARELHDDGYEKVAWYGIAFFGKDCAVRVV